jgi:NAD(P)-dependent dehydrogenase (short-subunit alcohol dehydrogenase family)
MKIDMAGKIALVTGGSEGIGFAIANALAQAGARVFITGRRAETLQAAAEAIGPAAVPVQADSSDLADLDALFQQIGREAGRLDLVVANAAVAGGEPLGSITEQGYNRLFDVNVKGTVFTVQGALPLMPEGGAVLLLSSIYAFKGAASGSLYGATKAAIRSLARSFILDLKGRDIRVNVLSPGAVDTEGLRRLFGNEETATLVLAHLAGQSPLDRVAAADEIAAAALFLLSDQARYVTGADLQIDGGAAQV